MQHNRNATIAQQTAFRNTEQHGITDRKNCEFHVAAALNSSLPTTDKLVLVCLAIHSDPDGRCVLSNNRIASLCLVSARTVIRALKKIEGLGLARRDLQEDGERVIWLQGGAA